MNKQTMIWQAIVLGLGICLFLFLFVTLRKYWLDQNEIKARSAVATCITEMKKIFSNQENFTHCIDVKAYEIK